MSEQELDRLFDRYREACGSPEAGKNFMPHLWQSIEARQSKGLIFARAAKAMAAFAAVLSLALALFLAVGLQPPSAFLSSSYVEAIESDHAAEFATFFTPCPVRTGQLGKPRAMRRSSFSAWVYLLMVFAAGTALGVVSDRLYTAKSVIAKSTKPGASEFRHRYVEELRTRLKLDANQVTQLSQILDDTDKRMKDLHERYRPEMTAIHKDQAEKVHKILNDTQDVVYDKMRQERQKQREAEEKSRGQK